MPPGLQYDVQIGTPAKGFMLARTRRGAARSWRRSSTPSVPGASSPAESRFGTTAPELAFREVFDTFDGGDGHAYRSVAPPGGVHWSENLDVRFPGMAVHCQALLTATLWDPFDGGRISGVQWLSDLPLSNPADGGPQPPDIGFGGVFTFGRRENLVTDADAFILYPTARTFPPALDATYRSTSSRDSNEGPAAVFGSYFYVGGSSGNFHRFNLDGMARTEGPAATHSFHGFVNAGNRLWAAVGPWRRASGLRSLAPGTTAAGMNEPDWSATLVLGNGRGPIQDMVALGGQVFCGMPDGIYASDQSGTVINVTGAVGQNANQSNFRSLTIHQGEVIGQHVGGIYAHNPTTTTAARTREIAPAVRSSRSPVRGIARAVHSFGGWLYAGVWTGSESYLRAGREMAPGDWRWHTLQRLPGEGKIGRLHVDGITYGSGNPPTAIPQRMWAAIESSFGLMADTASAPLYFWPIPRLDANPLAPDPVFSANYVGSARLDLPGIDRGAPGVVKVGETLEVWADGMLSGARYADVYYAADRGPRTLLGRAQTSPVSTLLLGSTNGSFVTFRNLDLSLESFNTTPGTSQVYRAVVLLGNLRPQYVETIEAQITLADDTPDRRGTRMRSAEQQLDDLRALADPLRLGGQPHRLVDLAGATSYVVFDGMPTETESYQEGGENAELMASIRMVVMTLTQSTQPG